MKQTRKILVALLVLMTILVSLVAVTIPASAVTSNWMLKGGFNSWEGQYPVSVSGNVQTYEVTLNANTTYEFKIHYTPSGNSGWYGNNGAFTESASGWEMSNGSGVNNCKITAKAPGVYVFEFNTSTKKLTVYPKTTRIYFNNTANWSKVNCHYWYEATNDPTTSSWPGKQMTFLGGGVYYIDLPSGYNRVIFNNGSGTQTGDLTFSGETCRIYNYNKDWSEYHTGGTATCTAKAKCTVCESAYGSTNANNHSGTAQALTSGGTANKHAVYSCCGVIANANHSYTTAVTAPTCTAKGYTTYTCSCGYSYKDNYVDEIAHTPAADDGNCLTAVNCTVCGTVTTPGAEKHDVETTIESATCTEDGYYVTACKNCDYVAYEKREDALGHKWDNDCDTDCNRECGKTRVTTHVMADATCEDPSTCKVCGHTEGDALNHNYVNGHCDREGCDATDPDYCFHTNRTHVPAVGKQCYVNGNVEYWVCNDCHKNFDSAEGTNEIENVVIPMSHAEATHREYKAPTCIENGNNEFWYCAECGQAWIDADCTLNTTIQSQTILALDHDIKVDEAVAPTCLETGLTAGEHCDRCDYKVEQEVIPAEGHSYNTEVTNPDCVNRGYTTYTCSVCDDTYVDNYVDALDHDIKIDEAVAPTCTETGLTEGSHCTRCNDATVAREVVPATGHMFIDGKCACGENRGTVIYFQNNWLWTNVNFYFWNDNTDGIGGAWPGVAAIKVGNDNTYDIYAIEVPNDATGFLINGTKNDGSGATDKTPDIKEWTECTIYSMIWNNGNFVAVNNYHNHEKVTVDATCTEPGSVTYKCGNDTVVTTIAANGHSYSEEVTTQPGCETEGVKTFTCSCSDSYTETVAAKGHTPGAAVEENRTESTCTVAGSYDSVVYCSVCEAELNRETVTLELAAHNYNAVVTNPDCVNGGYTTYTCSCGDTYTGNETEATGHTWVAGEVKDPTCTEGGYTNYACACGETKTDDATEATGHTYNAVVTNPDCVNGGYTTYTCSCGDTYVDNYVDALGHSYESVVTEPTFDAQGYTTHTCSVCGDSYVDNYTDMLVAVVMIGDKKFVSIEAAFAAAVDGDVITVVADVTVDSASVPTGVSIDVTKSGTLTIDGVVVNGSDIVYQGKQIRYMNKDNSVKTDYTKVDIRLLFQIQGVEAKDGTWGWYYRYGSEANDWQILYGTNRNSENGQANVIFANIGLENMENNVTVYMFKNVEVNGVNLRVVSDVKVFTAADVLEAFVAKYADTTEVGAYARNVLAELATFKANKEQSTEPTTGKEDEE